MASLYEMTKEVECLYSMLQNDEIDEETFADTFEAMSADKIEGYCQIIYRKLVFHQSSTPLVDGLNASRSPLPNRLNETISSEK